MSEHYSQLAEGQRPWEERENEKRSGGPMAATVDRVTARRIPSGTRENEPMTYLRKYLDAAIRHVRRELGL